MWNEALYGTNGMYTMSAPTDGIDNTSGYWEEVRFAGPNGSNLEYSAGGKWMPSVTFEMVKEVREEMRGLYRVLAVDYKNDEVVVDKEVIASSNETAKLKALAPVVDKYDLDDLDVKAIKVMDVRKKPEPQRVIVEK